LESPPSGSLVSIYPILGNPEKVLPSNFSVIETITKILRGEEQ